MTREEIEALPAGPQRLQAYLKAKGETLTHFAGRIEVANAGSVWKYIKGVRCPRPKPMAAIVRESGGALQPSDFLPGAS